MTERKTLTYRGCDLYRTVKGNFGERFVARKDGVRVASAPTLNGLKALLREFMPAADREEA